MAVATYLIGMLPIVFLTLWAVLTGASATSSGRSTACSSSTREIERGGELRAEADVADADGPARRSPRGARARRARRDPSTPLEDGRYHIYESNPVPWWMALLWLAFFVFAVTYLIRNLLE